MQFDWAGEPSGLELFDEVAVELYRIASMVFQKYQRDHGAENICAYALYCDSDARTISPACNVASHLARCIDRYPGDATYLKWSPAEWAHEFAHAEVFDGVCALLGQIRAARLPGLTLDRYKTQVFERCVEVMSQLRREGLFGSAIAVFSVTDANRPDEVQWIAKINTAEHAAEFSRWHGAFALPAQGCGE